MTKVHYVDFNEDDLHIEARRGRVHYREEGAPWPEPPDNFDYPWPTKITMNLRGGSDFFYVHNLPREGRHGRRTRVFVDLGSGDDRGNSDYLDGLTAGLGADYLKGNWVADIMPARGGPGPDRLVGLRGADILKGGPGRDVCIGGPNPRGKSDRAIGCEVKREIP
jgi:Ca2+-binding RTX toxin-like protein